MSKKTTLSMALLVAGSISLLFSCSKSKDNNTDQLASLGKATVTGPAYATLVDTVGAATSQAAPAGTVIHAWIDTKDLVLNADNSMQYAKKYYTATVGADGFYSFSIDVSKNRPAVVHIEGESFMHDVIVKKVVSGTLKVTTESKTFTATTTPTVTVYNDLKVIQSVSYN